MTRPSSRRVFLQSTAVTAAALHAPAVLRAEKVAADRPIIGQGAYRYQCIHDWLSPPSGEAWGDTHGVDVDSQGRIYVCNTIHPSSQNDHAVAVYDPDGKLITSWGSEFKGGAHGLDLRTEPDGEFIYHCDVRRNLIIKTDLAGEHVWVKAREPLADVYQRTDAAGKQIKFKPTNVAFAPNGDFYVGDGYGSSYILQYNRAGEFVRLIGTPGSEAGQFRCPHGLWVDARDADHPMLAVADRSNHRIQYMTLDGQHIKFITDHMRRPCDFDIHGDLMVVPDLDAVVTILDKDNQVVAQLGDGKGASAKRSSPRDQMIPGKFIHPHDATFLPNGDILVAEWVPIGRLTLLRKVS
ncbi:hypothetical protein HED60_06270 [Planctomycetales bacterium ZRK34]|nr:hypothetical protein HED60_06270 [Planctomycetales bacterium ZRK34]